MELTTKPRFELAKKTLPGPLLEALTSIFSKKLSGCGLVGGTALSGFYAAHRRSDDIDLVTQGPNQQRAAVLAVRSLAKIGINFNNEFNSAQFYKASCSYKGHYFTIDVVEDVNIFREGQFVKIENKINVASLETLLMTKAATLVSRCSEKDLFDLIWLFANIGDFGYQKLIEYGQKIDNGVNGEAILLSVSGSNLRQEPCGFAIDSNLNARRVLQKIERFRKDFLKGLSLYLRQQPAPLLKELFAKAKKLKNS